MNKTTKGALAAGAAVVLLLGGAGSYALWSDEATNAGGTVTAGTLTIDPTGPGVWRDVSPAGSVNPGGIIDVSTFRMVPGDVLEYTTEFEIGASGENLTATLSADQGSIGRTGGLTEANTPVAITSTVGGTPVANNTITSENDGDIVQVQARVTFSAATTGTTGQGDTVNLTGFIVNLQQTRDTP